MRSLWPFLIASLLLMTWLSVGCNKKPPRMKNQPTNLDPGTGDFGRPKPGDGTKHFPGRNRASPP